MPVVSESRTYKRQGRQKNHGSWWKHLREYKRSAHKRCRQLAQRLIRHRNEE